MKAILTTQRADLIPAYGERRDALDQRWTAFLRETGALPVPCPNDPDAAEALLARIQPEGILLTGGNSPLAYGGDAPERDAVDRLLIAWAENRRLPLIGVCRGMQSLILYFGGALQPVENHRATRHLLTGEPSREVNSYHTLAARALPEDGPLQATAQTADGVLEAVTHRALPMLGIMWHPEREQPFAEADIDLFRRQWNGGGL